MADQDDPLWPERWDRKELQEARKRGRDFTQQYRAQWPKRTKCDYCLHQQRQREHCVPMSCQTCQDYSNFVDRFKEERRDFRR